MKGRRVTVDLNPQATIELDRLRELTGLGTSEVLRFSVTLFRMYVAARAEGKELRIVNPVDLQDQVRLEFPIHVQTEAESRTAVSVGKIENRATANAGR